MRDEVVVSRNREKEISGHWITLDHSEELSYQSVLHSVGISK